MAAGGHLEYIFMLIIQPSTKFNFNPTGPNFHLFCSTAVGFRDIGKDVKFKMAAGGHLRYIFMLIIQLITKINLYPEGPNFDSFRSAVSVSEILSNTKIQDGGHAHHTTEY